ncbi:alpha/beta fold hydrolase [Solirubrobacter sp. CPCC 204708]|uniref:Alpha/beta fold hydrolase n=1 Tax=Solirubrobacter deserti TaxID=2282478 RepID=A0ABT4RMH2_9ACTN|nr:alpha/beta fold hydrolase [Solirubrobacter deserti]MBE2316932.1 alpha/beta fold hydrolase [Solirubrobacter deserti]MDA0139763.1 alpha/beta fold hydrolase [Solirubrobacter deserti]
MDFRLLGPLEVIDGGGVPLKLGGRKPRALLARLALEAGKTVSVEQLVDDLWGEEVPESAVKMVHIHVSALRKALPAGTLHTRPPGYALELPDEALDLDRFERLRREGRVALEDGDAQTAADRFAQALELWRGPALEEFSEPFAHVEAAHLRERQDVCLEDRIDADLALGRHADLVGELESLVATNPLRERLRAQLMVALYRSGRQADALAVYHAYRETLAGQLGLEPSPRMRELERRILRQDATLDGRGETSDEAALKLEPIRYVQSVGGYSIAYQVVGDGPIDIIFVHGFICAFQPGWEWPALASFYRGLARFGRLILFDKRGTGLSDRVLGIASLEERMDDVRAVMDAVGAEKAVVIGVSEGGPMCTLFAATHPDRTQALVTLGAYARRNWAPDYPIGRRAEQDGWLRPTAEQWGRYSTERFLAERAPSIAADEAAIDWYTSYLVRGASPAAVAAITDMNEEIDVRHVLASVRVPSLVLYRAHEYLREASRYMGARLPGAQVLEMPGADHLPWEGDQASVLAAIEQFLDGLRHETAEPNLILTTVLEADVPEREHGLVRSAVARFRGQLIDAPPGRVRASFDGPARAVRCACALAESLPHLRAGVHTGECELLDGRLTGPALEIASGVARAAVAGEILATSTVQDLVAGSGIEFSERGAVELPLAGASREWRLFTVER